MTMLYPTADQRERCRCGDWDEDHEDKCAECGEGREQCPGDHGDVFMRWHLQILCRDGKGEFERETRPSHDD